ncbi:MAG: GtrA family protein [Chloroflexi bacterium]|nr:GtrA family protein [Chloroflexota bacterium]
MKASPHKRFIKFALVGLSGTIVDFSIFNLCISIFHIEPVIASVCSFSIAVVNNFVWNRLWTYPESKDIPFMPQLIKFGIISVIGLIIRTPLFAALENPLILALEKSIAPDFFLSAQTIGHNVALAIAIVVVLFWNYFANRFWTYKGIK